MHSVYRLYSGKCVWLYVYAYTCTHIYTYPYTRVYAYPYTRIHVYAYTRVYVHIWLSPTLSWFASVVARAGVSWRPLSLQSCSILGTHAPWGCAALPALIVVVRALRIPARLNACAVHSGPAGPCP